MIAIAFSHFPPQAMRKKEKAAINDQFLVVVADTSKAILSRTL